MPYCFTYLRQKRLRLAGLGDSTRTNIYYILMYSKYYSSRITLLSCATQRSEGLYEIYLVVK